jgi:hypothetical protein
MVEGAEWDVSFDNGRIVWNKPSEETMITRVEKKDEFRQWGSGWRKYILWGIWKVAGSPEGVFETEDGKILTLRDLRKEKESKGEEK